MSRSSGQLQRGRACENCRRRKIRCDGAKPVCEPCQRLARPGDECEYGDGGRTSQQQLEDNVARLERRLKELEAPFEPSAIRLHNPYPTAGPSSISLPGSVAPQSSSPNVRPFEEPPMEVRKYLLQIFLSHASELGFFLNPTRFFDTALIARDMGHYSRPSPAVLSVAYLWGISLSQSRTYTVREPEYLARSLHNVANALSHDHPDKILHSIQASVLISQYFFRCGRMLEGKYNLDTAVSLVIANGLHAIRSPHSAAPRSYHGRPNQIDEGERINAFWTVFTLHNCWSCLMDGPASQFFDNPGAHVDTPWPLDTEQYEKNMLPAHYPAGNTALSFLQGIPSDFIGALSFKAMLSKASILFERACNLASQVQPNMSRSDTAALQRQFSALDTLIESFGRSLPGLDQAAATMPQALRTIFLSHSLAHMAVVSLHSAISAMNTHSQQKAASSAESVLKLISLVNIQSLGQVSPIFVPLWTRACQVLVAETSRLRSSASNAPTTRENQLVSIVEHGFRAIAMFSPSQST
ncbi:Zn(2)-Cys(6) binuclear cluster domain-containing protein [Mycena floridula]|nr:Zn(2)-Cys(6) binuclear cluster domain-containing protein [Mycena floridula]